jgi:hypothetical protein
MPRFFYYLTCLAAALGAANAYAHAIVGDRIFPATLAIDDPGISDEADAPQIDSLRQPGDGGGPSTRSNSTSADISKRITDDFGISLGGSWLDEGGSHGLDNFDAGAKYVFFTDPAHETMLSFGADWDIGGTGAARVGAEDFSTFTPAFFFGRGMGDLPDSAELLKPIAITGTLGYAMPDRDFSTDADTGERSRNPQSVEWGFTTQYSIPYLQQHVRDMDIPAPFSNAIPIVEFAFSTPTSGDGHTTGTINPGVIFMGQDLQLGLEAQLPINSASGTGVGYMAQLHFYLDDIFPKTFGRPLW